MTQHAGDEAAGRGEGGAQGEGDEQRARQCTLLRLLTCDPRQNVLSNIGNIRVLRFFIE